MKLQIRKKKLWCSLKRLVASEVVFRFGAKNEKNSLWEYPVTNDA